VIYLRSEEEIALIRRSSQMVSACLDYLGPMIVPGKTPNELDRAAEEFVRDHGGTPAFLGYRGYPNTLCISVNQTVVHGIPNDVPLEEGDIVSLDMGVLLDGYYGDSARTFPVGEIPEGVQRLLNITRECLYNGIEQAVEGKRIGDIGHAIQSHAEAFGFSVVRDLFGHGIGRQLHEEPQIPNYGKPGRGTKLSVGMVLAIEPMITMGSHDVFTHPDGWTVDTKDRSLAAHFEHTVAVGVEEAEILTVSDAGQEENGMRATGS
jgi:methionyl aminopeptidase